MITEAGTSLSEHSFIYRSWGF